MAILTRVSTPAKPGVQFQTLLDADPGTCVFVGLDVHKETIVLAARKGNEHVWLAETTFIVDEGLDKLRKFLKKLWTELIS